MFVPASRADMFEAYMFTYIKEGAFSREDVHSYALNP